MRTPAYNAGKMDGEEGITSPTNKQKRNRTKGNNQVTPRMALHPH